ncbi:MAG: hypothetical protein ACFFCQ_00090 [Promethearchaeota archaeon]
MEITFKDEHLEKLKKIAEDADLSVEIATRIILEQFVEQPGGRIYVGRWRRGTVEDKKGFRFVIQWPFKSGFTKKRGDEI